MQIDVALVQRLVRNQFPDWAHLPITPVAISGWDNRTFHLGDDMSVRLPSAEMYAAAVAKEQLWLPRLAPQLPLPIPAPVALGQPDDDYPWHWSIYKWLPGTSATHENVNDLKALAIDLADFLNQLQHIDPTDGPTNEYRGDGLAKWQPQAEKALTILSASADFNSEAARHIWQQATQAPLVQSPVWFHGDVAAGNLLVVKRKLTAVIDFGGLGVGDPACDTTIAWTFFDRRARQVFRQALDIADSVWDRGRGWALWKAMIVVSGMIQTNPIEAAASHYALTQLFDDYRYDE